MGHSADLGGEVFWTGAQNYAVWESKAYFRVAFTHPEFRAKLSAYPASAVASPHLFQRVAVPGVCVG